MHKLPQLLDRIGGQLKILGLFVRRLADHQLVRVVVPLVGDEVGEHRGRQFLLPLHLTPLISLIQGI
jgi:hypothetical protein